MNITEAEPRGNQQEVRRSSLRQDIVVCSGLTGETHDVLRANRSFEHVPTLIAARDIVTLRDWTDELAHRTEQLLDNHALSPAGLAIARRDLVTLHTPTVLLTSSTASNGSSLTSMSGEGELLPDAQRIMPYATAVVTRISALLDEAPRLNDPTWARATNPRFLTDDKVTMQSGENVLAEAVAKVCVGIGMENERPTINHLMRLSDTDINSPEFAVFLEKSAQDLSILSSAITVVAQDMPLDWFMQKMMPLFKAINVNGETYRHSGSQQPTSHIADYIIWGATSNHEPYEQYREKNTSPTGKAQLANAAVNLSERGSLVDQVLSASPDPTHATDQQLLTALGVLRLIQRLQGFRAAHTVLIRRSTPSRNGTESSGGDYDMAFWLKEETDRQAARLAPYRNQSRMRGLKLTPQQ